MDVDILLCEEYGPVIRRDHCAVNRCPCCGKKDFEVLVSGVDIAKAFAVFAGFVHNSHPEAFKKMLTEIEEWSEDDDYIG